MSREVTGVAATDGATALSRIPPPARRRRPPRWAWPAAAVLATVLASVVGWQAYGAVVDTVQPPAVSAAATRMRSWSPGTVPRTLAVGLTVVLVNAGASAVRVDGFTPSSTSAEVTDAHEPTTVPPRSTRMLQVAAVVACVSARPLTLPPLDVTGSGGRRSVVAVDSAAILSIACLRGGEPLLRTTSTTTDGTTLSVDVLVPSGRPTRVDAVRAGGVQLTLLTPPGELSGAATTLTLVAPERCPDRWRTDGLPRSLAFDVDLGGPATLQLEIGTELPRWLLATACREAAA